MYFFFFDEATSAKTKVIVPINGSQSAERPVEKPTTTVASSVEGVVDNASSSSAGEYIINSSPASSTSDARVLNENFLTRLDSEEPDILYLMRHTVVEDGYENEVVQYLQPYYAENPQMTLFWLYGLYAKYMDDRIVFSSILDILYCLDVRQSDMRFMISLIENGLNSKMSVIQEAAIKVTEKWRTIECLVALRQATYASNWIKKYAGKVMAEISNELGVCISA